MKKKYPIVNIFSPASGEDYTFIYQNSQISTLQNNMFAVEAVGLDWLQYRELLLDGIQATAKIGFFYVHPWWPGVKKLQAALMEAFPASENAKSEIFSYFVINPANIDLLFSIRHEHGDWNSGEWYVGGCASKFQLPILNTEGSGDWLILREIENVGCLLCLEEMQQSTFISRKFDQLDKNLEALLSQKSD